MPIVKVNEELFETKIKPATEKVLVDFYADWCGPCKMLAPILGEIEAEYPSLIIAKINVDESTNLAIKYGIQSIPTVLVMQNGEVTAKAVGLRSKEQLLEMLK